MQETTIENTTTVNESQPIYSYFMDKVFPILIGVSISAVAALVVMYFTVDALVTRVSALEENSVRKDVLSEAIEPMKDDLQEVKADIKTLLRESNQRSSIQPKTVAQTPQPIVEPVIEQKTESKQETKSPQVKQDNPDSSPIISVPLLDVEPILGLLGS